MIFYRELSSNDVEKLNDIDRSEQIDLIYEMQYDLMYVSRNYRRQGIATRLMDELSHEAKKRGAKSLYISSTETESAVNFYRSTGSVLTGEVDRELFEREPKDIHMIRKL